MICRQPRHQPATAPQPRNGKAISSVSPAETTSISAISAASVSVGAVFHEQDGQVETPAVHVDEAAGEIEVIEHVRHRFR